MSNVLRGQVWRNIHGTYVTPLGVGPCYRDGIEGEALWVEVCDADGNVTGGRIPMELTFGVGPAWTLVKESTS